MRGLYQILRLDHDYMLVVCGGARLRHRGSAALGLWGGSAVDGAAPPTSTGRCFAIETYCIPEPIRLHYCRGALVMPKSDDGSGVGVLSPHAA